MACAMSSRACVPEVALWRAFPATNCLLESGRDFGDDRELERSFSNRTGNDRDTSFKSGKHKSIGAVEPLDSGRFGRRRCTEDGSSCVLPSLVARRCVGSVCCSCAGVLVRPKTTPFAPSDAQSRASLFVRPLTKCDFLQAVSAVTALAIFDGADGGVVCAGSRGGATAPRRRLAAGDARFSPKKNETRIFPFRMTRA